MKTSIKTVCENGQDSCLGNTKQVENLFLKKKPAKLLLAIKHSEETPYTAALARSINCTYTHAVKLLHKMHGCGLVEFQQTGRAKHIILTGSGRQLAEKFEMLFYKGRGAI